MPLFVVYDAEGYIVAMFQPSLCDRLNFRMVYGIARYACPPGGRLEITRA